jgi:hypothetical protein
MNGIWLKRKRKSIAITEARGNNEKDFKGGIPPYLV